jgi:hypothetical protein
METALFLDIIGRGETFSEHGFQSTDFVVVVFVLVPRPYKILIYEDEHEDEKNQIRSHA